MKCIAFTASILGLWRGIVMWVLIFERYDMNAKPFQNFKKHDWVIWILSVIIVTTSNILTGEIQIFTLCATVIGVTAHFCSKGNVWGRWQWYSVFYMPSLLQFQYYGEITPWMTMPIAVLSIVSWIRHPYEKEGARWKYINWPNCRQEMWFHRSCYCYFSLFFRRLVLPI